MGRQSKVKLVLGILAVIILICLFGFGVYLFESVSDGEPVFGDDSQSIDQILEIDGTEYNLSDNVESYLFIGTDDSGDEDAEEEYRGRMADFLLLYVMDKTKKTHGFIQINRDTIAEIKLIDTNGEGEALADQQICTAHWYGGDPEMSCENTVDAVSHFLGDLPIDGYYSVHYDDIHILNHAIGGVDVTLKEDFTGYDPEMVKGKTLTLTDDQAVAFVRARMDVGDGENLSRMERQLQYMEAYKAKAAQRTEEDPAFINDLYNQMRDRSVTDIPENRISVMANQLYKSKDLGILQIDGTKKEGNVIKDGLKHAEFYADPASIAEVLTTLCGIEEIEE